MPCIKKKRTVYENNIQDNEISFEDYVKTLELDDFLNYPKTCIYLEEQHNSLAHLIFHNINLKADITVFHECPELAKGIDKMEDNTANNQIIAKTKQVNKDINIEVKSKKNFVWGSKNI